ncbi:MAG: TIGR01212 family radical SAM protein [Bacteroidetes bacterium]|nr:TIGR01212 family radical SAM protein [Bacteroidota bacterium]
MKSDFSAITTDTPFYSFSEYLKKQFSVPVQKISLNIGSTCPNRDGTKGYGGCTYCNVESFSPDYCQNEKDLSAQLETGIRFFENKKKNPAFLAYFQSYSNTYADFKSLQLLFDQVLCHDHVIGLVIGTRPDCLSDEIISYLEEKAKTAYVAVELGIESTLNRTLEKINRCHTFEETVAAFDRLSNRKIHLGGHLIMGLPGESKTDILNHAKAISKLPVDTLKLHQLQVIKGTIMAHQYKHHPEEFHLFDYENYVELVSEFLTWLRPDIAIERFTSQSPAHLLIAPDWGGIKNYQTVEHVKAHLQLKGLRQGLNYTPDR